MPLCYCHDKSTFQIAFTAESLCIKSIPFIIINLFIYLAVEDLPAFRAETAAESAINITDPILCADFPQLFHDRGASVPAENAFDISP
jgi:hypothetical protein